MDRREALAALALVPLVGAGCKPRAIVTKENSMTSSLSTAPMPVVFAAHGAPILLDDAVWMGKLAAWSGAMKKPKGIVMVSAHWEARPVTLGATSPVPLVYDFYNFPERYYQTQYVTPAAGALGARVGELLAQRGVSFTRDEKRGLDHGAYVPLVVMYPDADVPVLQVSMPALVGADLIALGAALAPLRDEGVLIFGSGFITHNMRYAFKKGVPTWATEFDAWVAESLAKHDVDALVDFQARGPGAQMALPTWEHYAPLLVALGAATTAARDVTFPITGWWMDSAFTQRSVQFG